MASKRINRSTTIVPRPTSFIFYEILFGFWIQSLNKGRAIGRAILLWSRLCPYIVYQFQPLEAFAGTGWRRGRVGLLRKPVFLRRDLFSNAISLDRLLDCSFFSLFSKDESRKIDYSCLLNTKFNQHEASLLCLSRLRCSCKRCGGKCFRC